jgi:F-type H+-transporting ATPase subunit delta
MAELATIARPYADALFKSSASDHASTSQWLDRMAAVAGDPDLLQFADNPKSTVDQVLGLVEGVMQGQESLSPAARQFLRTVLENGRLSALPEMAAQFRARTNAEGGASDATIYSAFPMEGAVLAEVTQALEKRFGRKLFVSVQLQPELIGGIRVLVGDEVLDTSVKARLEQMKVALAA